MTKTVNKTRTVVKWNYINDLLRLNTTISILDPNKPAEISDFIYIDKLFHPLLRDLLLAINHGDDIDMDVHDRCLERVLGEKESDLLSVAAARLIKHGSNCPGTYFNDCLRSMKPGAMRILNILMDLIITGAIMA